MITAPLLTFAGFPTSVPLRSTRAYGLRDSSFTVEAWIRPEAPDGHTEVIVGTDETETNQGLHLAIRDRRLYMGFYNNDVAGHTILPAREWIHVAFVYDRDTQEQRIYLNGVLDVARGDAPPFVGVGTVYIGRCFGSQGFRGAIRELRFWSDARSSAEILDQLLRRASGSEPGLRAYFPLDEASGDVQDHRIASVHGRRSGLRWDNGDRGAVGLYFPGDGRLEIADRPELRVRRDQTLELVVWPEDLSGEQTLFGKAWGAEGALFLRRDRLVYRWGIKDHNRGNLETEVQEITAGGLIAREWNKVAVVRSFAGSAGSVQPSLRLYVNGKLVTTERLLFADRSAGSSPLPWVIGAPEGARFTGYIKSVRLWARALEPSRLHAPLGADADRDGLLGQWSLDQDEDPVRGDPAPAPDAVLRATADIAAALAFRPVELGKTDAEINRVALRSDDGRWLFVQGDGHVSLGGGAAPTANATFEVVPPSATSRATVGRTVSLQCGSAPGTYDYVYAANVNVTTSEASPESDPNSFLFSIRTGLAGSDTISFESVRAPGHYLRHRNYQIHLDPLENLELYRRDASFHVRPGLTGRGVSFESENYPGHYIRRCGGQFFIDDDKRTNAVCERNPESFRAEASMVVRSDQHDEGDEHANLRAANGRFVRVLPDGSLMADALETGAETAFQGRPIEGRPPAGDQDREHFAILAPNGRFLSAPPVAGYSLTGVQRVAEPTPELTTGSSSVLRFGQSSVVRIEPSAALHIPGPMTVECWVRPSAAARPDYWSPVVGRHGPGGGWELRCDGTHACFMYTTNQGGHLYARARYDAPGAWLHLAGVYDGRSLRLFLNGLLEAECPAPGQPVLFPGLMQIGQNPAWPDRQFLGDIQEVRLWNTARSPAELLADFKETVVPTTSGLVAAWRVRQGQLQMFGPTPIALRMEGVELGGGGILAGGEERADPQSGPDSRPDGRPDSAEDPERLRQERDQLRDELASRRRQVEELEQLQQAAVRAAEAMERRFGDLLNELNSCRSERDELRATLAAIEAERQSERGEILASTPGLVSLEEFIQRSHDEIARARAKLDAGGSGYKLGKVTLDLKVAPGHKGYGVSFPSADELARSGGSFSTLKLDLSPPPQVEPPATVTRRAIPDLAGQTELMARRKAAEAGFHVEIGSQVIAEGGDGRMVGRVVMQLPRASAMADVGSTISIFIGKAGQAPV